MEKFQNIKRLFEKIRSSPELTAIAEDKRIPILLNIMEPTFGPIFDSLVLGNVRDKSLADKFQAIEENLESNLSEDDGIQLLDIIADNREILFTSIANVESLMDEHNELKKLVSTYLAIPSDQEETFIPSSSFKFVVIAGASGTGKDVQLELLHKHQFKNYRHNDILTKFSTRKPRNQDSDYYEFIKKAEFLKMKENGDILFPYDKRNYFYGFDKVQFVDEATGSNLLFSIFTEFEMAQTAKAFLTELGINNQFILFNASENVLRRRAWHRNFSVAEVKRRITSIQKDIQFIEQNKASLESIYDFVEVGDDKSINEIHKTLIEIIDK